MSLSDWIAQVRGRVERIASEYKTGEPGEFPMEDPFESDVLARKDAPALLALAEAGARLAEGVSEAEESRGEDDEWAEISLDITERMWADLTAFREAARRAEKEASDGAE